MENVKIGAKEFYNLPFEEKRKFGQREGEVEGYGQAFVMSEEQKLDWADMFFMVTLPPHLRKPHLFPKLPLPFRFFFSFSTTFFLYYFILHFIVHYNFDSSAIKDGRNVSI